MDQRLYELLRQCTVRVTVTGKIGHGTGFFVAPGLILTCAHVIKAVRSEATLAIEVFWREQSYLAQTLRYVADADLALLQVDLIDHPCVFLQEEATPFDTLYSYGYSDDYPSGDPATFVLEGKGGERREQLKFKTGQVRPGLSGAPLLNTRTGYVCGIIQLTRDRNNDLGGRAISVATMFRLFSSEVEAKHQQFHLLDRRWTECLEEFAMLPKRPVSRPENYIPLRRNPLFQQRAGEFEQLEHLLFSQEAGTPPPRIGLVGVVGMGGIGKTQFAVQLAYRYGKYFPAGIFWMSATGTSVYIWQRRLAKLAFDTGYLPPDDNPASPDNEIRRARYICRYLARQTKALLILDNVEEPDLITSSLPALAGGEMECAILYTSRNTYAPSGVTIHRVKQLTEEASLRLLLNTKLQLLTEILSGSQDVEAQAARAICRAVGYLPLALIHLSVLLVKDRQLTLKRLLKVLEERGMLAITMKPLGDAASLFTTFFLSWEKVADKRAQRLFKLATYFPEAVDIPLWLLGIASGLGEETDLFEPLGEVCMLLQELSFLEISSAKQVRLHPLIREFGRKLIAEEGQQQNALVEEAEKCILEEFTDLNRLERRIRRKEYFECLEEVRAAVEYVGWLGTKQIERLQQLERWLDQESYLLASGELWPERIPNLLYQQLFNRSVKEGLPLSGEPPSTLWLRQMDRDDVDDPSLVRVFASHREIRDVQSVAFLLDGGKILTSSSFATEGEGITIRLWDATSGHELMSYEGHSKRIWDAVFSSDGSKVLTGSEDRTVCLWEMASGKLLMRLQSKSYPRGVAISPDGSKILIGHYNKTISLWETASRKLLAELLYHKDLVNSVAFSLDGSKFLTSSHDGTAQLWETESGRHLKTLEHSAWVIRAIFSPDGVRILTSSTDGTARLWDATSGKLLMTLEASLEGVYSIAFSADGKWILTGCYDHVARLWETSSGRQLERFEGHRSVVSSVAFSPDGRWALTGSWDGTARLWDLARKKTQTMPQGHLSYILGAVFSPDGSKVLTGSRDGTARLWEVASGKSTAVLQARSGWVKSVAFSLDGRWALTGSSGKTARLWDVSRRKCLMTFHSYKNPVSSVAFSPDSTKICTGSYQVAQVWETSSGTLLTALEGHTNFVNTIAFSQDGSKVLTGSSDETARLWEVASGTLLVSLQGHSGGVEAVAFSSDGTLILTGSSYRKAHLWEVTSGKLLCKLENHATSISCVAFSPDNQLAITRDGKGRVYLWQICGPQIGRLLGIYIAAYEVAAVYWHSRADIILADTRGPHYRPHFYKLRLDGMW
jgi:WD40 repeat protein